MTSLLGYVFMFIVFVIGGSLFSGCFLLLSTAAWPITPLSVFVCTMLGTFTFEIIAAKAGDSK